jgi:hypothetical protein
VLRRLLPFLIIYAVVVSVAIQPDQIQDPDLGFHLRMGDWIWTHGQIPTTALFSSVGEGRTWIAYSWLFELLLVGVYHAFGLLGVLLYTAVGAVAIIVALQVLLAQIGTSVEQRFVLLGLTAIAISPVLTPRPWLLSILLFVVVCSLLVRARGGATDAKFWLLAIFALWANLHVEFVYGLLLVGLYAAEPMLQAVRERSVSWTRLRAGQQSGRWWLLGGCVAATLVSPLGTDVWLPVFEYGRDTAAFQYVAELQAMRFRSVADWIALALTLAAAFVLGLERARRPVLLLLLAIASVLSFRTGRDAWIVAVVSAVVLGIPRESDDRLPQPVVAACVMGVAFLLIGFGVALLPAVSHISDQRLRAELESVYPAAAIRFVEDHRYAGPLYNHLNWGGYLIWQLPRLPVALDGRTNLYGSEHIGRAVNTWNGVGRWADDPDLVAARLVIAQVDKPLTSLLMRDDRFEEVYRDAVAAVFVARSRAGDR